MIEIEKSNNTIVYDWKSARKCANTYKNIGTKLYLSASNKALDPNDITGLLYPALVNMSFACELYLKEILQGKKGHNLMTLYDKLTEEQKIIIKTNTINRLNNGDINIKNYVLDDFDKALKDIKDLFVICRYHYELVPGKNGSLDNLNVLKAFLDALSDYVENFIKYEY